MPSLSLPGAKIPCAVHMFLRSGNIILRDISYVIFTRCIKKLFNNLDYVFKRNLWSLLTLSNYKKKPDT